MPYVRKEVSHGKTYELTQISEIGIDSAWYEMKQRFDAALAKIDASGYDEGVRVVLDANSPHERFELVGVKELK